MPRHSNGEANDLPHQMVLEGEGRRLFPMIKQVMPQPTLATTMNNDNDAMTTSNDIKGHRMDDDWRPSRLAGPEHIANRRKRRIASPRHSIRIPDRR